MFKKLLPHIVAVLTFTALTVVYFLPYYQGMVLSQGDVVQWEGMSKEITDWDQAHPNDPALWTDAMFGGMPSIQIFMQYSGNLVNKVYRTLQPLFPEATETMFLMFLGFYILLLCFEVNPWLALAGALGYGLMSFTLQSVEAGHNTKVQAMSLMAPVIGGVVLAYRKKILMGAAVMALFLSLAIDANHLQVAYYLLMALLILGVYFFVESILEKRIVHFAKASVVLVLAGVLALLPNIANLWGTQEYAKATIRGGSSELTAKKEATKGGGLDYDYAARWSYGLTDGEILTILIPDMKGGGGGNTLSDDNRIVQKYAGQGYPASQIKRYVASSLYFGHQPFTSGPVYFGAALVFLFVFSMLLLKGNVKWALLALTLFSMLLAFGHNTPFHKWMFDLLPAFNKFRTPAMALVIAQLTIPLLAVLGISELLKAKQPADEVKKKLLIAVGVTAGIVFLVGIVGSFMGTFSGPGDAEIAKNNPDLVSLLKDERASMVRNDAMRSLFFILAAFGLVWFFIKKQVSQTILVAGLALVFFADNWMVAKRYLNSDNFVEKSAYEGQHQATQADLEILKDTDPNYRVFNVTRDPFNDAMTSYYHKSVGGYHPAKLILYQDLIENQISKNNMNVLNMLNTRYFIVENPQNKQPMAQRNPGALGNAWFVREVKWAANADDEMASLTNFNPKSTVVIDKRYKQLVPDNTIGDDSAAQIKLLEYTPNKLTYQYSSNSSQLAVFSEVYYENGWHAYVDGKLTDYFRANYALRAMTLPAG
jgi:hypothetical protein